MGAPSSLGKHLAPAAIDLAVLWLPVVLGPYHLDDAILERMRAQGHVTIVVEYLRSCLVGQQIGELEPRVVRRLPLSSRDRHPHPSALPGRRGVPVGCVACHASYGGERRGMGVRSLARPFPARRSGPARPVHQGATGCKTCGVQGTGPLAGSGAEPQGVQPLRRYAVTPLLLARRWHGQC